MDLETITQTLSDTFNNFSLRKFAKNAALSLVLAGTLFTSDCYANKEDERKVDCYPKLPNQIETTTAPIEKFNYKELNKFSNSIPLGLSYNDNFLYYKFNQFGNVPNTKMIRINKTPRIPTIEYLDDHYKKFLGMETINGKMVPKFERFEYTYLCGPEKGFKEARTKGIKHNEIEIFLMTPFKENELYDHDLHELNRNLEYLFYQPGKSGDSSKSEIKNLELKIKSLDKWYELETTKNQKFEPSSKTIYEVYHKEGNKLGLKKLPGKSKDYFYKKMERSKKSYFKYLNFNKSDIVVLKFSLPVEAFETSYEHESYLINEGLFNATFSR